MDLARQCLDPGCDGLGRDHLVDHVSAVCHHTPLGPLDFAEPVADYRANGDDHRRAMPTHKENRHLPYSPRQMYDLVADVRSYPAFLPWCSAARIRKETPVGDHTLIDAELVISFKVFREKFGSRVTLWPEDVRIDTEYLDGPFRYLKSNWTFVERPDGSCDVTFYVDFEFRNAILQSVIGVVFNEAMQRVVRAFERRAQELYG